MICVFPCTQRPWNHRTPDDGKVIQDHWMIQEERDGNEVIRTKFGSQCVFGAVCKLLWQHFVVGVELSRHPQLWKPLRESRRGVQRTGQRILWDTGAVLRQLPEMLWQDSSKIAWMNQLISLRLPLQGFFCRWIIYWSTGWGWALPEPCCALSSEQGSTLRFYISPHPFSS